MSDVGGVDGDSDLVMCRFLGVCPCGDCGLVLLFMVSTFLGGIGKWTSPVEITTLFIFERLNN